MTPRQRIALQEKIDDSLDWFKSDLGYTAPELYDLKFSRFKELLLEQILEVLE